MDWTHFFVGMFFKAIYRFSGFFIVQRKNLIFQDLTLSLPNGPIRDAPRFYIGVTFHHMFI
jgi:hypothetical protein